MTDEKGPPTARRVPHEHVAHGVLRSDPYAWMGDAAPDEHPELVEHLAAEREWYDVSTAHLDSLSSRVRSEMEARVPEEQRSGTWTRPRFYYYTRDARDRDYGVIWRESRNNFALQDADSSAEGSSDDDFAGVTPTPEVVLDINTLDAGTGYLDLGLSIVSPDEHLLAYAVDTAGDERFVLRFRDLRTGEDLPDVVAEVATPAPGRLTPRPSSTPSSTTPGATTGSAPTASAPTRPRTATSWSRTTGASSSPFV